MSEKHVDHIDAWLHLSGHIVGRIKDALVILGRCGIQHLSTYTLAIEARLVKTNAGDMQGRLGKTLFRRECLFKGGRGRLHATFDLPKACLIQGCAPDDLRPRCIRHHGGTVRKAQAGDKTRRTALRVHNRRLDGVLTGFQERRDFDKAHLPRVVEMTPCFDRQLAIQVHLIGLVAGKRQQHGLPGGDLRRAKRFLKYLFLWIRTMDPYGALHVEIRTCLRRCADPRCFPRFFAHQPHDPGGVHAPRRRGLVLIRPGAHTPGIAAGILQRLPGIGDIERLVREHLSRIPDLEIPRWLLLPHLDPIGCLPHIFRPGVLGHILPAQARCRAIQPHRIAHVFDRQAFWRLHLRTPCARGQDKDSAKDKHFHSLFPSLIETPGNDLFSCCHAPGIHPAL